MSRELKLIAGVLDDEVPSTTGLRLTEVEAREMAECVVSMLSEYGYSIVEAFCKCGHRSGVHTEMHRSCSVELGTWICPCEGYAAAAATAAEEDTND